MGVSVLLPEKFNICRSRVPLLSHKSFNISASLAFADILVGIVVVPFSLTQVGLSKVQFKRISVFFSPANIGTVALWLLLVPGMIFDVLQ